MVSFEIGFINNHYTDERNDGFQGTKSKEMEDNMRVVYGFFHTEVKRFFSRKNMTVWLIILLLLLLQANIGVNKVKKIPETIQAFKQIQKNYFEKMNNYNTYGFEGIGSIFIPSPNAMFSWDSILPPFLTAHINASVKLEISNNFKGRALIPVKWTGQLDITSVISWLITLMALWYGFCSYHTPKYTKFLTSLCHPLKTFLMITISRFILFAGAFIFTMGCIYIFARLRGINFTPSDISALLSSLLVSLVMMFIFFIVGGIIGSYGKKAGAYIILIASWIILNFGVFWMLNATIEPFFPTIMNDFQTDLNKYEILMKFERKCEKSNGKFNINNIEAERKLIESYWGNEYKQIENKEKKLLKEISIKIEIFNHWSLFFPTTFFRLTASEASSGGYVNYIQFYKYVIKLQREFLRFWIDRNYYNDPKEMVNFIQSDEGIFRGTSITPPYFIFGLLINLGYGVILFFIGYFRFKRMVFPKVKNVKAFYNLEINLESCRNTTIHSNKLDFNNQFLNVFFGQNRNLDWTITLDKINLSDSKRQNFLYLPSPKNIPGELKGKHLLILLKPFFKEWYLDIKIINELLTKEILNKRFQDLALEEIAKVLIVLTHKINRKIFVFDNFSKGLDCEDKSNMGQLVTVLNIKDKMIIDISSIESIWLEQNLIISIYDSGKFFTSENYYKKGKKVENIRCFDDVSWLAKESELFNNLIVAESIKILYENEKNIKKNIERLKLIQKNPDECLTQNIKTSEYFGILTE